MKISEAIQILNTCIERHGDMDLAIVTNMDGYFQTEFDRRIAVVGVPEENGTWTKVCGMLEPETLTEMGPSLHVARLQ